MSNIIPVSAADLENIARYADRRLSSIKEDEEADLEDLINRGLLDMPEKIPGTEDYLIRSVVPATA